jgi:hypothetical protein
MKTLVFGKDQTCAGMLPNAEYANLSPTPMLILHRDHGFPVYSHIAHF